MPWQGTLFDIKQTLFPTSLPKSDRLLRVFEEIHNHIYANEGFSAEQAFTEMLKLLFIKIFDEKNNETSEFYIEADEYEQCLGGRKEERFLRRVLSLHKKTISYFSGVMDKNEEIDLRVGSLAYAVRKLQHINLSNSPGDVKGLAFQKFVYSKQRGQRGQFFTPEPIVKLCVEISKPQANEKVLDPACGTGGFLTETVKYVFRGALQKAPCEEKARYIKDCVFGIEINPMVAKIAKMRLVLEGNGYGNIIKANALADAESINHEFAKVSGVLDSYENYFDVILTNPPFGSQGRIRDKTVLRRFELGHKWVNVGDSYRISTHLQAGQVPDILFIERCLSFLKDGGRLAIVLPNGDLENTSLSYVRAYLREKAKIVSVVKLPAETFIPFGTGVKTSVLFLKKTGNVIPCEKKEKVAKVLFARVTKIGYQGNKNGAVVYKKDSTGEVVMDEGGEPIVDENVTGIIEAIDKFQGKKGIRDSDECFTVDYDRLSDRLDLDYYKPSVRELEGKLKDEQARRLGDLVKICRERSAKLRRRDLTVEYIELSDINTEYSEISNSTTFKVYDLPSRAAFELEENDIITAVAGNSIGTIKHMSALVTSRFAGAICSNGFRVLKDSPKIDRYYLLFYLRTEHFLRQVLRYRTGAAIPAISDGDLADILVYLPRLDVQREIGKKIKKSFELRQRSRELLDSIEIGL